MPEFLDIEQFLTFKIIPFIERNIIITHIVSFITPKGNIKAEIHQKFTKTQERLSEIQKPCKLIRAEQRGKELALIFQNCNSPLFKQHIILQLSSGAYFDEIVLTDMCYYPYNELANLGFISNTSEIRCLLLVDTKQFINFVKWQIHEGEEIHWNSIARGPCVLTEKEKREAFLWQAFNRNPMFFMGCSVAYLSFCQFYSNGFGAYTVSEGLHRFFLSTGIMPHQRASVLFQDPDTLQKYLYIPTLLKESLDLFTTKSNYSPAELGPKQVRMKQFFRLEFLQVYRKKQCHKEPVIAIALKVQNTSKTLYVSSKAIPSNKVPTEFTTKRHLNMDSPALIKVGNYEVWWRIKGDYLTKGKLGVGPFDWHSKSASKLLQENGKDINKEPKEVVQPDHQHKKKRPHPRCGKKQKKKRLFILNTGGGFDDTKM